MKNLIYNNKHELNNYADINTFAARLFFKEVSDFSKKARVFDSDVIWYETKPDEKRDFTLISQRVYGNRYEVLTVMACSGISNVEQELTQRKIALPTPSALQKIKQHTGFECNPNYRNNFKPTWNS